MRVLNDIEDKKSPREFDAGALLAHVLYSSMGFLAAGTAITLPFMLLPMIISHLKLEEPLPKVAALLGALIGVTVFQLPLSLVLIVFVLGIFVGEGVRRKRKPWPLLVQGLGVALLMAGGWLWAMASSEGMNIIAYWNSLVAALVANFEKVEMFRQVIGVDEFRNRLTFQAPFFYAFMILLILWTSLGIASFLKWYPANHPFTGAKLRQLRLPHVVSAAFLTLFVLRLFRENTYFLWVDGLFLVVGMFAYIEGTVVLSNVLQRRKVGRLPRALTYSISMTLGFYALMGLGVLSQWVLSRGTRTETEEQV